MNPETVRFCEVIRERLGLQFDADKSDFVSDVLGQRVRETGSISTAQYLDRIGKEELRALAERLTVTETFFFRNGDNFHALTGAVLPDRIRAQGGRPSLHVLSAGCASGEEPYSIAILMHERFPDLQVAIRAIDINPAMLQRAERATYSPWALRETPNVLQERYFHRNGKDSVLVESIRRMVAFEERNLLDPDPSFWRNGSFDVIFCRNVIMYLSPEVMRIVVGRLAGALAPGGYLFLGHAETLRGISQEFHLCHTHGTFYYQRRQATGLVSAAANTPPAEIPMLEPSTSWMDVIRGASERIETLARQSSSRPPRPAPAATSRTADISLALQLLRQDRFAEALQILKDLPDEDADGQLLRALLLANSGDLAEAEKTCVKLLRSDELNAGAHYLKALCRESAGDRKASVEHDQTAVYLDPTFAMPHFHLGLLARRAGDLETARKELEAALTLFAREDASRILLFGGGFSRESLIRLCESELKVCGGRS